MGWTMFPRPASAGRWVVGLCLCTASCTGPGGPEVQREALPPTAAQVSAADATAPSAPAVAVESAASVPVPLSSSEGAPTKGPDFPLGSDSLSALSALMGDAVRSDYGFGGMGVLRGTGRGGGGWSRQLSSNGSSSVRRGLAAPVTGSAGYASNTERYAHQQDSPFEHTADAPLSTFSVDVDTASYSNVRRFLSSGQRPPPSAVRIEELVNYFQYADPEPPAGQPLSITSEVAAAPWAAQHRLVRIGLRTRAIGRSATPARNLVFLIDVSGSMASPDKLPLLQRGLRLLTENLTAKDRVAIVVYAGASGVVLPSTPGSEREKILDALDQLQAQGSTNGGEGIRLAYQIARANYVKGGINRVVLGTDGDFNVGTTSIGELTRLIVRERKHGVFLTVLGFGHGNLADSTMESLADHGNGNYAYIDSVAEAQKVLVREAGSTLVTVAKDVKLQVEWNPKRVQSYRLLGFENRRLAARDFRDDTKDAGELGAGHNMTALYEIVPAESAGQTSAGVDALRYQTQRGTTEAADSGELMTLKVRYKQPDSDASAVLSKPISDPGDESQASIDLRWAAAVASFGMVLRDSPEKGAATLALADSLARGALGKDPHGDRHELVRMISLARGVGVGSGEDAPVVQP